MRHLKFPILLDFEGLGDGGKNKSLTFEMQLFAKGKKFFLLSTPFKENHQPQLVYFFFIFSNFLSKEVNLFCISCYFGRDLEKLNDLLRTKALYAEIILTLCSHHNQISRYLLFLYKTETGLISFTSASFMFICWIVFPNYFTKLNFTITLSFLRDFFWVNQNLLYFLGGKNERA